VFVFTSAKGSERVFELGLPRRAAQSIIATVTEAERERERLQCFSQPTSLIT